MVRSKKALRTVPVGTVVRVTHFRQPELMSGTRELTKVQSNAWAMKFVQPTPEQAARFQGDNLWIYWDTVRCTFDEHGFTAYDKRDGLPLVRYEWT